MSTNYQDFLTRHHFSNELTGIFFAMKFWAHCFVQINSELGIFTCSIDYDNILNKVKIFYSFV